VLFFQVLTLILKLYSLDIIVETLKEEKNPASEKSQTIL